MQKNFGRRLFVTASLLVATAAVAPSTALAQASGDKIRKIVLVSWPQGVNPQAYQASQMIAQQWRQLGLDVEVRSMPWAQHIQLVWNEREKWDTTMWRMVGRPERSDPDEVVYNNYHSTSAPTGFNFVGYISPEYDKVAEEQRHTIDPEKRKALVRQAQRLLDRDQPQMFIVHPTTMKAFNKDVWAEDSIVSESGIGIRNFWTFIRATPKGAQKQMVLNSAEPVVAISPMYIAGSASSWVTELVWDRLARVGPDGLPQNWAAERIDWVNPSTVDVTLRAGMNWHDGKPVTVEDVIYSFEVPTTGNKVPMYKSAVADIVKIEKTGDRKIRFTLKGPNSAFVTATFAKVNLVPKHIWEPIMKDLMAKPENAESIPNPPAIGSGPFKMVRNRGQEEVVLDRFDGHFSAPKMERWVLRIVPNPEATLGMLRRNEINFLADYGGAPDVLEKLAKEVPQIAVKSEVDIGFEYAAFNLRRPPFNDVNFRRALSFSMDRNVLAQAAWNGYAVPSNSQVSPALKFWHDDDITKMRTGLPVAREILEKAGYKTVGGKLYYPDGVKETLPPN